TTLSMSERMPSTGIIDQDLARLINEHNHFRNLLLRYIRRSVVLCSWTYEQEVPSFLRQFEKVDKLVGLILYTREYALQSFQSVDRSGTSLLGQVDLLLARGSLASPGSDTHPSPRGAMNGTHDPNLMDPSGLAHPPMNGALNNNRLLVLAGEVKEAIRFWREQCMFSQPLEQKMAELDRVSELRNLALQDERSTIEEKSRAIRISSEQSKLLTDDVEPMLQYWSLKVQEADRPRDEHFARSTPTDGSGPPHLSLEHRTMSNHSMGSPANYSSQSWGPGS
ncbi:hypothetical protein CPC16_009074, partial [Podila verticillata]